MYFFVAGFRYKNAPLEVRERLSFSKDEIPAALKTLLTYPTIKEGLILSTCNRTEIYAFVEDTEAGSGSIVRFLADYHNIELTEIRKYMYTLMHDDTAKQIFKVASGMDSMVLGETEITCQVKEAFAIAQQAGTVGPMLENLFKAALATNKMIRTQTRLNNVVDNVSSAAIEVAKKEPGALEGRQITIVGAGKMAVLALKHLIARYDHRDIVVLNRSEKPLKTINDHYKCSVGSIKNLKEVLKTTDIVFVCTAAPHVIVKKEHIPEGRSMVIVDISVPRNVDADVADLSGIKLFNTDDLKQLIDSEAERKEEELNKAEKIVNEEQQKFNSWVAQQDVMPIIKKLRQKVEYIRKEKVDSVRKSDCPYSEERCIVIENLTTQIVNAILHDPTVRIKSTKNHEEMYQTAKMLHDMFNLGENG